MSAGGGEDVGEWAILVAEKGFRSRGGCGGGSSEVTIGYCSGPLGRGYAKLAGPFGMRWPNAPAWKEEAGRYHCAQGESLEVDCGSPPH